MNFFRQPVSFCHIWQKAQVVGFFLPNNLVVKFFLALFASDMRLFGRKYLFFTAKGISRYGDEAVGNRNDELSTISNL